jgi:mono/diheme cytochrome c family protein
MRIVFRYRLRCGYMPLFALALLPLVMTSELAAQPKPSDEIGNLSAGQQLYRQHCAGCHGVEGNGQGVAAGLLYPKPRNFRLGRYKLVSTDNSVPTRDDFDALLVRGMPGSSMPSWSHLSAEQRGLLIDEIVRLTGEGTRERSIALLKEQEGLTDDEIKDPAVQEEIAADIQRNTTPGQVSSVPKFAPADAASIARGKDLYVKQACVSCHGSEGKGDGVQKMIDDEGVPLRPRDLTRGIYKGGHDVASLYRRMYHGMPGTPMPASKNLTPEQIVDLSHFLLSLSTDRSRQAVILKREKIVAREVTALPADSGADAWRMSQPTPIRLTPLWWRDNAPFEVNVQAVHDGRDIAFRLEWEDPVADSHAGKVEAFKDAVAMEVVPGPDEPFLGMGSATSPVDLWMWDADLRRSGGDLEQIYPRTVVDIYPFSEQTPETAEYDRPGTKTAQQPDVSLPAKSVGNLIVRSAERPSGASSLAGAGPGSATFRFAKSQLVAAVGHWNHGRWTVLFRRSLNVGNSEHGVSLIPGKSASVAFAVWDGAQRDRNGQKQISIWQELVLERTR